MRRVVIGVVLGVIGLIAWACWEVATQPIEIDMSEEGTHNTGDQISFYRRIW